MNLEDLHIKLEKHLEEQSKNWKSFIYAQEKGFYQGYDEIKIDGWRPTEKRFKNYKIDKYLSKEKSVLDIGSNCGFFSIHTSKFVKEIVGIEINPFLVSISNDTKEYLQRNNVTFYNTSFENSDLKKKYDVIFSLANDSTIDQNTKFNFNEYIEKIRILLNDNGILIFESQAMDNLPPSKFNQKFNVLKNFFTVLEDKIILSEYPVNVPKRKFLVLEKNEIH